MSKQYYLVNKFLSRKSNKLHYSDLMKEDYELNNEDWRLDESSENLVSYLTRAIEEARSYKMEERIKRLTSGWGESEDE